MIDQEGTPNQWHLSEHPSATANGQFTKDTEKYCELLLNDLVLNISYELKFQCKYSNTNETANNKLCITTPYILSVQHKIDQ